MVHSTSKNLLIYWVQILVKTFLRISYRTTWFSMNKIATWGAVILDVSTCLINFQYQTFITSMRWLAFNVFGSSPRIPVAIYSTRSLAAILVGIVIVIHTAYLRPLPENLSQSCKFHLPFVSRNSPLHRVLHTSFFCLSLHCWVMRVIKQTGLQRRVNDFL